MSERPAYYNEELKKRFIKEKEKTLACSDYLYVQFNKVAEMEFELNKDASNWTAYEILEFYKLLNTSVHESLVVLNSVLSQYTQFCLENNLVKDNQNHYLECTNDILLGCINKVVFNKKVVDRETVIKWVNELPNPKDQFILLSLFEFGKSKDFKDIVYAKPSDLHENQLTLSDRTVTISDKLKNIIYNCVSEDRYYAITGRGTGTFPLVDHGYIVKNYPNQDININDYQKGRNIYMSCQRIFDYLGVKQWMTPNAITESGKLHMIKVKAKELNMSPMDYIYSPHIHEVEKQFNFTFVRSSFAKKYGEYLV